MIENILVARDFSVSSDRALHAALQWARPADAVVHLLAIQVTNDNPFKPAEKRSGPIERLREQFKDRTHSDMAQSGYDPGSLRIKHEVQRGEAAGPAIVRYAERANIDLIVMGTTGRRGVKRAFLGSVAEEVVRTAPCPVCTVRAAPDAPAPKHPKRIIVPVDFSAASRHAVSYGVRLAQQVDASVTLLHAIENPSVPKVYGIEVGAETKALSSEALQERVRKALNTWIEDATAENTDPPPFTIEVCTGAPDQAIRSEAIREDDALVMATEGRTGMDRMVLGSVAEAVLRRATCPVITARSFKTALQQ